MAKFEIFHGAQGQGFVGEPGFGEVVAEISRRSNCTITRHAADQEAAGLLHSLGQHTQAEVILLHAQGVPGYGPANPVNGTTHNRYNDGVAYRWWPWGFKIPKWARGIDCNVGRRDAFLAEARKMGYVVSVTYPGAVGEAQHVNFRKAPKLNWWVLRPVRKGMRAPKGSRAHYVIYLLRMIKVYDAGVPFKDRKSYLDGKFAPYRKVGDHVEDAIKRFQRRHGQTADGIVGIHTIRSMQAEYRRQKKSH